MLEKLPEGVGHVLRNTRAGLEKIAFNQISGVGTAMITVRSTAFVDHAPIPEQYTADGVGISPPLQWEGVPGNASVIVLIVEDADAPTPKPLVHAIVVDIAAGTESLEAGALASPDHEGSGLQTGRNSYLSASWLPPDPPPGHGVHRYAFQIFALVGGMEFSSKPGRDEVLDALRECTVASGCLIGTYERPDTSIKIDAASVLPINDQAMT